jgi:hypothetical protein
LVAVVAPAPERLVDLERYPIDALDTPVTRALVERCCAQLAADGACELPGFLTGPANASLTAEAAALTDCAHHSRVEGTPYLDFPDASYPGDHPRRALGFNSLSAVAYDLFPAASGLRAIYEWPALRAFVAAALGQNELFPYRDPLGALNLAVMKQGDELAWHFDQTDFVVSLALVPAERGGDFEFAPRLRSADDECYDDIARVLAGDATSVRQLPMTPGTLLLFEGRYSLHRVTPIEGATPRLVALLAYDTKPDTTSTPLLRLIRYGREQ